MVARTHTDIWIFVYKNVRIVDSHKCICMCPIIYFDSSHNKKNIHLNNSDEAIRCCFGLHSGCILPYNRNRYKHLV